MILVDANLLIYAYDRSSEQHAPAKEWLETVMSDGTQVRFAWATLQAFLRITTNPAIYRQPMTIDESVAVVNALLEHPSASVLQPGPAHWGIFSRLLTDAQVRGPLVADAHLAALAIEHGATLCSTDRDFRRFDGVRLENPLA